MQIPILIEPLADGRFRARAGEPMSLRAEGNSPQEATQALRFALQDRFKNGTHLAVLDLGAGERFPPCPP